MRAVDETEFRDYVAGHLQGVRRMAFLLCGDWHHAEDIAQMAQPRSIWRGAALRTWVRWTVTCARS